MVGSEEKRTSRVLHSLNSLVLDETLDLAEPVDVVLQKSALES